MNERKSKIYKLHIPCNIWTKEKETNFVFFLYTLNNPRKEAEATYC